MTSRKQLVCMNMVEQLMRGIPVEITHELEVDIVAVSMNQYPEIGSHAHLPGLAPPVPGALFPSCQKQEATGVPARNAGVMGFILLICFD
jgi:hypothetical protein